MSSTDDTKIIKQLKATFPFGKKISADGQLLDIKMDEFTFVGEPKQVDAIMFSDADSAVEIHCGNKVITFRLDDVWAFATSRLFADELFDIDYRYNKRVRFKLTE